MRGELLFLPFQLLSLSLSLPPRASSSFFSSSIFSSFRRIEHESESNLLFDRGHLVGRRREMNGCKFCSRFCARKRYCWPRIIAPSPPFREARFAGIESADATPRFAINRPYLFIPWIFIGIGETRAVNRR